MFEPVRVEPVDERADERRPRRSRQTFDQQVGCERREHEPRQEQDVVGEDGMQSSLAQRNRRQRWQEHGIRERQRERFRIEDVAAEERPGIASPLLVHPAHPPHREQRIAEIRHRVHVPQLRLQKNGAEGEDAERRDRRAGPPGPGGPVDRVCRGLEQPGTPRLPPRPLDAKRPDTAREPPPDGQHDRGGNQRPVGVAHRQPDAANLGVEAAGPRDDDRPDGERQGEPVETDGYTRSQVCPANLNRALGMCGSAASPKPALADSTSYRTSSSLIRGTLSPGPPYTLARGDPDAPLRSRGSLASARSRCL